MTADCVFAIDFTYESMTAGFVLPDGTTEGAAGFDLTDFLAGESRPLDKLTSLLAAKARTATVKPSLVAVSIPCDLSADRQTVVNFPQAIWLNEVRLPEVLQQLLDIPAVMERRGVTLLSYDRIMLGLPIDSLIIGCYIDDHYENALWVGGKPVFGKNGAAGNIAHMTIQDREDICHCGKYGCVDLYGAGIRFRQLHTMIFSDTPMNQVFERHGDHPIVLDYISMMAYPIAIEANILDPDFIILGGYVPSMPGFPRQYLEDEIRRHSYYPSPSRELVFVPSAAQPDSCLECVAHYALGKIAAQ